MKIEISPATFEEKPILRQLLELYQYDFSEIDGADLSPAGWYDYPYLDHYWTEPDRSPFLVRVDGKLAGFVLVWAFNYVTGEKDCSAIAEFFILRKYRRQGIGEVTARFIFDRFPGRWQVAEIINNLAAAAFWRKVIGGYTQGDFQDVQLDTENWHGPVQSFSSLPRSVPATERIHNP